MRGRTAAALRLAIVGCCVPGHWSPAAANPLDAFGFGARSVGLGGAVTADVTDFSANYYNPAGLARGEEMRVELGYTYVDAGLELNGADLNVDPTSGAHLGIVVPGELFGHAVAASLALHLPDDHVTRVRALPQAQPRYVLFDNRPQRIVITTSLAFEVAWDLYLGAGLTYMANTGGVLDVDGKAHLTNPERTTLLSGVDVNLASVRYPSFGAQWAPRHFGEGRWRFGLAWREPFSLRLDLDVLVQGDVVGGPQDTVAVEDARFLLTSINDTLFSPRQVFLGAAYHAPRWRVGVDLGWMQWSDFPPPTAEVRLDLDLEPLPFTLPIPDPPLPAGFHDIVVPRIGGSWTAVDTRHVGVELRGGYFFEASPAPDQPGLTNYVDGDKHAFAAGLGVRLSELTAVLPRPIWLDVAGQYTWVPIRRYRKDDPSDPVGDYDAGGRLLGVVVTASFRF